MISIDGRLHRIERAIRQRMRNTPPDPVIASFVERLCTAMALTRIGWANAFADDQQEQAVQRLFFEYTAQLHLIIPPELESRVWRRALMLSTRSECDPGFITRLQVQPEMRCQPIRLNPAKSAGGAKA